MSAVGREAEFFRGDGQRQAHHRFTGGYIVEREAAVALAARDELPAVSPEAGDAGLSSGLDGAADGGLREREDRKRAVAAGDDASIVGFAAQIEIRWRRGQTYTAPRP